MSFTMNSQSLVFLSILSSILLFNGNTIAQSTTPANRAQRVVGLDLVRRGDKVQTTVTPSGDSPITWVDLDYWSSLTWVPSSRYILGRTSQSQPAPEDINRTTVTLPDGTTTKGTLLFDNLFIDQFNASSVRFGSIGTNGSTGVLALGSDASVSIDRKDVETALLKDLVSRKVINDEIYSIRWDPDPSSTSNGTLLLGGIDTNAYRSRLIPLPLSRVGRVYTGDLSGISFSYDSSLAFSTTSDFLIPVVFDSTSSTIKLPEQILYAITEYLQAIPNDNGQWMVPCLLPQSTSLSFLFNKNQNLNIDIPFSQLISPDRSSSTRCTINIELSPNNNTYLGTIFQRSAYTVFDLSRRQLFVAPSSGKNFTEAPPILVEALQTATGIDNSPVPDLEGGSPAPPPLEPSSDDGTPVLRSKALPTEAIIGIVIAVVGVMVIAILIILLYRKKKKEDGEEKNSLTSGYPGYVNPTFGSVSDTWMNTFSVRSFEDYVAVEGRGAGWIVETRDGVRHASLVKKGRFKLGR
ncbi:hypothetical protein TWF569_001742 [Orbilia oligospora]|nr:hypothetical protein TWF569_001742 [Orbilia oligospora]